MLSFWERQSFTNYDFVVIGGGIVGLSTAISIKEKEKNADVLVLEKGIFPSGASTRNAGFACFGSLTELLADINSIGEAAALTLVEQRWLGLKLLRERLGDASIDFRNYGGYELITSREQHALSNLDKANDLLKGLFKEQVYRESPGLIEEMGFNGKVIKNILYNPFEGQIDTGKMMKSLTDFANQLGITIYTGAEVSQVSEEGKQVKISVANPADKNVLAFAAKKVAICTNAFTKKLIPDLDVQPGRGIVLVTRPLSKMPFKGVFHMEEGYYYFRDFNDRIIFGGGRNLDVETETTTEFTINQEILTVLKEKLTEVILPNRSFVVDHSWAGIMAFGADKNPIIKRISPSVIAGVRLSGMGIAIGSNLGEKLAQMVLE